MLAARCLMLNSYLSPFSPLESVRVVHVLWGAICWPLDVSLKFYLIDRYFSVHLTTKIGDVKLSTNVFMDGTAFDRSIISPYT